ncbi:MAG: ATP-binding cassette subfamily B multidrug efflux pump [Planctomycetota bacterium]|jgi:ATP-binding cassette subfamily B multidrug efflux pump
MLETLRPLWPLIRRYRWSYFFGSIFIVLSLWLKLLIPRYVWSAFSDLRDLELAGGALDLQASAEVISTSALLILGATLISAPTRTLSRLLILGTSRKLSRDLLEQVFAHMLKLSPSFFGRNPTGQLMSRCINDREYVRSLGGAVFMYLAETVTLYLITLPLLFAIDLELALIAVAPYPVFLYIANKLAGEIQVTARASQNALGEISEKVDESLSGQLVIKTMALEDHDFERFSARCVDYRRLNLRMTKLRMLLLSSMMGLAGLSIILVLGIGGQRVARGEMSFSDFGVMITYLGLLAVPTRVLGFIISSGKRGAAAYARVREILDSEVSLRQEHEPSSGPAKITTGTVRIDDLSIIYPPLSKQPHLVGSLPEKLIGSEADVERTVLDSISIEIPAGSTLGIVGHTGSGKTTLARVIARQLEVEHGKVFIDGKDITSFELDQLRANTGYVPQDAFLFSETLRDNVALGKNDASEDEVQNALEGAQLGKDLDQLPDGLETLIGERGVNLSGGQRQRTALARVLLLSPRLLILDDTLSAVDTHTADAILEHLRPFAAGRTTILIAHRLSSLAHADQIIVLEAGRIIERGTHDELLSQEGQYFKTWNLQERTASADARAELLRAELEVDFDTEATS